MPFRDFPNNGKMYYEYRLFFPRFNKEIKVYGNIEVSLIEKFIKINGCSSKIVEDYTFNKNFPSELNWNITREQYLKLPVFRGKVYVLDTTSGNRSVRFIISKKNEKFIARVSEGNSKT
jgi:hypothetical protein